MERALKAVTLAYFYSTKVAETMLQHCNNIATLLKRYCCKFCAIWIHKFYQQYIPENKNQNINQIEA